MAVVKFCGCSVTSFNSRLGWGSNQSSIDVNVVEDSLRGGDFFNPPGMGQPCYFTFGPAFKFWGIIQNWKEQNSISGKRLFTVQVKDPRDILDGTQIVTGVYNGSTFGIPNILNCYGYWENLLGFGGASLNQGGMLWSKILTAVQALTNNPAGAMGGPLNYLGVNYAVDLSMLPVPPPYYRLSGGPTMSLLSAIQQICDDGGCEFFVELDPGTTIPIIRIYTVSRYAQPPFGTITQLTNSNWGGTLVRSSNGLELRNDPTTHFLIGGEQQTLYQTDSIQPFWGYDTDGNPIDNIIVFVPNLGYCNAAFVNCQEIGDSFNDGRQYYFLTEFEMRFALENTGGSWEQYVVYETYMLNNFKSFAIGPLGVQTLFGLPQLRGRNIQYDILADFLQALPQPAGGQNSSQLIAQETVRRFVNKIAQNWYGKKYWVSLPFVTAFQDPETLVVHHSQEISDGGWLPEGASPLGLTVNNILQFQQPDGRYEALAIYDATMINLQTASPDSSVIQFENNSFYTKISVNKDIFIWPQTGIPTALITVNNPVITEIASIAGDAGPLDAVFQQNQNGTTTILQNRRAFGAVDLQCAAPRKHPLAVSIPLKSNIASYGPWYLVGAPGRVITEVASDLTPWEYGGTAFMELAAQAKVTSAVSFMTMAEAGDIELVGMPLTSLGRTLLAGGPETTNIEVRMGSDRQGLTTAYQFKTFTSLHLDRFTRNTQERLKTMGRTQNEIRKAALAALAGTQAQGQAFIEAAASTLRRLPTWQLSAATPHPVIIASAIQGSGNGGVRVGAASTDPQEGWGGIGPTIGDNTLFENSSLVSFSALAKPFANNPLLPTGISVLLPRRRISPTGISGLSVANLNPYSSGNNDFEYLSAGNTSVSGTFLTKQGIDWNNIRGIAQPTPMMMIGWGYRIDGSAIPAYPLSSQAVGPQDLLYDHNRGCWTSHDLMFGYIDTMLPGNGGNVNMTICDGRNRLNASLPVYNFYSSSVAASSYITAGYLPYSNKWQVISADCASGVAPPAGITTIG
jgi:hypothetical protein